jgi:pyruvate-ferredoxin/flavodoxin oxidoreductase
VATHALSIFGDHSDVMACRQAGWAMLCSASPQEAHDLAAVGTVASLRGRIPVLHFFDGFRTSHEIAAVELLRDEDLHALCPQQLVAAHRSRALSPDRPVLRGAAQNPDTFFQAREAANPFYEAFPEFVRQAMADLEARCGRRYRLFDYEGHPEAERVVVLMGSAAVTASQTVRALAARGERVGALIVRLYRPFSEPDLLAALPETTRQVAVLDRTKEPGAPGEPLFLDVCAALRRARRAGDPRGEAQVVGGRYGLSGKELTPAMVKAVLEALAHDSPPDGFTVGITDDVTHTSLPVDPSFQLEAPGLTQAVFFGLGSDGTVGSNKNTIKIIGEGTDLQAQGYFVYDSKKSGAVTVSHLRFGPQPIEAPYLIEESGASFVACHQLELLERFDVLGRAAPGATFLLNAPFPRGEVWAQLPREVQEAILAKGLRVFTIDAYAVAGAVGLGRRISTVMQACFFALSGVLPTEDAISRIKEAVEKSYGKKGAGIVQRNFAAIDQALDHLHRVEVPAHADGRPRAPAVPAAAPELVKRVTAVMMAGEGERLPVSAFPPDGTWPLGTARWEKRNVAHDVPVWADDLCIQCNKCAFVCPHATIRAKVFDPDLLQGAPEGFRSQRWRGPGHEGQAYAIQVAPEDCTGCTLCVQVCPAKDKTNPRRKALNMVAQRPVREREAGYWDFFLGLPEADRTTVKRDLKGTQLLLPMFEFSGACAGCGETPYIKLLTQLFGDRLLIANATGCSSIYGGNLPTTPYCTDDAGRGPAWSNSLFEDNAEFGFGMRLAVDAQTAQARELLRWMATHLDENLAHALLEADQSDEAGIAAQRERVARLRGLLAEDHSPEARRLEALAEYLVRRSVWLVGGDGWAYDIGFGGLDHVLASGRDVNVLVLDTEVYSNTGGQMSKATPLGAAAKFAAAGKGRPKKDLGLIAMSYGDVYVGHLAFGAKDTQTLKAIQEAEAYPGPSLLIAYSHCIAHGYDLAHGLSQQKLAVDSGAWPLYRYDPGLAARGKPPLHLDSGPPKVPLSHYTRGEARFRMAERVDPARFKRLLKEAQAESSRRYAYYQQLADLRVPQPEAEAGEAGGES